MDTIPKKRVHLGRNIARLRELRGIKQEELASKLDVSQSKVSLIEQTECVDDEMLMQIALALDVSPEAIRQFSEEAVFNIISNTFHNTSSDSSTLISSSLNYQPTFNTIEKIVELYERLLTAEREKLEILKRSSTISDRNM